VVDSGRLQFLPLEPGDPMRPNRYGIDEPAAGRAPWPLWTLDLILMPLVAVDRQGNRLGMGGGYYDRSLAALSRGGRRPLLIGLAHQCQCTATLPDAHWDVPLDGVITEAGCHAFSLRARRFAPVQTD
jgi:5-formyltetrahydrofolate cyclo-ligase